MYKEIEIYQLINLLEQFFEKSEKFFDVGEMAGCNVIRYIGEQALDYCAFSEILIVSGIQDFVYQSNEEVRNHVFWKSLFSDRLVDHPFYRYDTLDSRMGDPRLEYTKSIAQVNFKKYKLMIINQTQMIPPDYLQIISKSFSGKIVRITDPFDIFGKNQLFPPFVVTDTFETLSPTLGFARYLYGVNTRYINKKAKSSLVYDARINRRSIGKLDDKQYVTKDPDLHYQIQQRQLSIPMRRNYKLIVEDDRINNRQVQGYKNSHSFGNGTLLHITHTLRDSFVTPVRLHSSKIEIDLPVAYKCDMFLTPKSVIRVSPANILDIHSASLHRYKHLVFVSTDNYHSLSIAEQYTLIKISQNTTFAMTK